MFYLPICFFYYLAKLIIFTRSSRTPGIFILEGGLKGNYLRGKFTISYVFLERSAPIGLFHGGSPKNFL